MQGTGSFDSCFLSPSLNLATNKWHALSLMSIDTSKMVSNSVFSSLNARIKLLNCFYLFITFVRLAWFMQVYATFISTFKFWVGSLYSCHKLAGTAQNILQEWILHAMSQLSSKLHALLCEDRSLTLYFWEDEC